MVACCTLGPPLDRKSSVRFSKDPGSRRLRRRRFGRRWTGVVREFGWRRILWFLGCSGVVRLPFGEREGRCRCHQGEQACEEGERAQMGEEVD